MVEIETPFGVIIFLMAFVTLCGYLLAEAEYVEYSFITPTVFAIGQGLLVIAVGVANTPVAKGVAVAGWFGWLLTYTFTLSIPSGIGTIVYAIIYVPALTVVGLIMLEVGKG